jgi:hypothetical protein
MGKWLAGIIGTVIAGVLVYWLTIGVQSRPFSDAITSAITPKTPSYHSLTNASYEVKCRDNRYKNIFTAIIKFSSKTSARWRYTNSTSWKDSLKVEYLSPHRLLLTIGKNDERKTTWELNFSEGFETVEGSYKFLQKNPSRWRDYVVTGKRLR